SKCSALQLPRRRRRAKAELLQKTARPTSCQKSIWIRSPTADAVPAISRFRPTTFLRGQLFCFEVTVAFGQRQSPAPGEGHRVAEHAREIFLFVRRDFLQPPDDFGFRNLFFHGPHSRALRRANQACRS